MILAAGLLGLAALAWIYVGRMAEMPAHAATAVAMPGMDGAAWVVWLAGMWAVMMVAMMVPSATPTILLFAAISRRRRLQGQPAVSAAVFTLGYLLVWTLYAAAAAGAQWQLHRLALLSPAMAAASPLLGGGLLIAAGLYQWMPLKGRCLSQCRSPLGFFSAEWREGAGGALLMGMRHGSLLRRLLLDAHGVAVRERSHERALGGGDRRFRAGGEAGAGGRMLGRMAGVALVGWGLWLVLAYAARDLSSTRSPRTLIAFLRQPIPQPPRG